MTPPRESITRTMEFGGATFVDVAITGFPLSIDEQSRGLALDCRQQIDLRSVVDHVSKGAKEVERFSNPRHYRVVAKELGSPPHRSQRCTSVPTDCALSIT